MTTCLSRHGAGRRGLLTVQGWGRRREATFGALSAVVHFSLFDILFPSSLVLPVLSSRLPELPPSSSSRARASGRILVGYKPTFAALCPVPRQGDPVPPWGPPSPHIAALPHSCPFPLTLGPTFPVFATMSPRGTRLPPNTAQPQCVNLRHANVTKWGRTSTPSAPDAPARSRPSPRKAPAKGPG